MKSLKRKRSWVERKLVWSLLHTKVILPSSCWHLALSKQPRMLLYSRRGHVTVLTPSQPTVSRYHRRGWMCVHAWNDSDWFSISHSVWFLCRSLPVSSPPKDELRNDKSAFFGGFFFSIQSPQHNADGSSNEVVIMHITDIKRKELKSLHV